MTILLLKQCGGWSAVSRSPSKLVGEGRAQKLDPPMSTMAKCIPCDPRDVGSSGDDRLDLREIAGDLATLDQHAELAGDLRRREDAADHVLAIGAALQH